MASRVLNEEDICPTFNFRNCFTQFDFPPFAVRIYTPYRFNALMSGRPTALFRATYSHERPNGLLGGTRCLRNFVLQILNEKLVLSIERIAEQRGLRHLKCLFNVTVAVKKPRKQIIGVRVV